MHTPPARAAALSCLGAALLLAAPAWAKPAARKHVPHHAAPAAPTSPAVLAVKQYLAAHAGGQVDRAYALLSPSTQAQFPVAHREEMARQLLGPDPLRNLPPGVLPVLALFLDIHDTLHFKFRALGPSPRDPAVVLVRAYQVGAPLSSIKTIQVVTAPGAGSERLLDAEKTVMAVPGTKHMRQNAEMTSSMSDLKQISLGIIQYVQDNDEKMPDADKWVDEVMPYIKTESVFADPSAPGMKWAYAFNRALSGKKLSALENPAATVLLFESTDGNKNASDAGASVPKPGRHNGGTDYAFVDGHVKWVSDRAARPSFEITGK